MACEAPRHLNARAASRLQERVRDEEDARCEAKGAWREMKIIRHLQLRIPEVSAVDDVQHIPGRRVRMLLCVCEHALNGDRTLRFPRLQTTFEGAAALNRAVRQTNASKPQQQTRHCARDEGGAPKECSHHAGESEGRS